MRKLILLLTAIFIYSTANAQNSPPQVSNVHAQQRTGTKLVDITYDLTDGDGDTLVVTVQVSSDSGSTFTIPATSLTGDVGSGVIPGTGKAIVWNAGTDYPNQYGTNFCVKVTADDVPGSGGESTVTDIDGNVYKTVKIGSQVWMAENLKVTRYRNGDPVPNVTSNEEWASLNTGAQCAYDNDAGNVSTYGRLYNWYAVNDSRNIAPEGWKVPTDEEWQQLVDYLGGDAVAGGKLKEVGTTHWNSPNTGATNESGFSGLPGGFHYTLIGSYHKIGDAAYFWSSSVSNYDNAWHRSLHNVYSNIYRNDNHKRFGYSVRCVRDTIPSNQSPSCSIQSPSDSSSFQQGTEITFTGTATDAEDGTLTGSSLVWTSDKDGQIGTGTSFTTGSLSVNTHVITLTATDSEGSIGTAGVTITITSGIGGETGTVTDIDGNTYKTVKIGNQEWMAENLKVTHYRNGEAIPNVSSNAEWASLKTGAQCAYNNDAGNVSTYGRLYNWIAVNDSSNIAPEGWHVPTDEEWQQLVDYLGGETVAGGKLKESGTSHWNIPNTDATNESGFSGLPGGYRFDSNGVYYLMGYFAHFWSSSEFNSYNAWNRKLNNYHSIVNRNINIIRFGFSVRCVKDSAPLNQSPTASIQTPENDASFAQGSLISFTGTASDAEDGALTGNSLVWSSDKDGQIGTDTSFTTSSLSVNTHVITLSATDSQDSVGTASIMITVTSSQTGTVTDIDGNVYKTVKIGNQWWMAENLKVTKYRNGEAILNVTGTSDWTSLSSGAYCAYDNDESNVAAYGYFYNWHAVKDSLGLAPEGWHVPTDDEWKELEMYLGMSKSETDRSEMWRGTNEGGKLKEAGTTHWNSPNTGATNESGFTGLPGGYRRGFDGIFYNKGSYAYFWSGGGGDSSGAWGRGLGFDGSQVYRDNDGEEHGFSVRCIKDSTLSNQSPSAAIQAPANGASFTQNSEISFTGTASDSEDGALTGSSLVWTSDKDGQLGTGTSFSTGSLSVNTHVIALTATDSEGAAGTAGVTITITSGGGGETGTVTDIDGNVYKTVKIGNQWWMAENLKVTKYRNGEAIPHVTDNSSWTNLSTGAYCAYNNDETNTSTYGRLYNWHSVNDSRNIAPEGWHVPTDEEWQQLVDYLGGNSVAGGKLKESGFSGLLGGYLNSGNGDYYDVGYIAMFWSSSEQNSYYALNRYLHFSQSDVYPYFRVKEDGCSVRCVRD